MSDMEEQNKERVGISTQKSSGPTTDGEGLASAKSPVGQPNFETKKISKEYADIDEYKIDGKKQILPQSSSISLGSEGFDIPEQVSDLPSDSSYIDEEKSSNKKIMFRNALVKMKNLSLKDPEDLSVKDQEELLEAEAVLASEDMKDLLEVKFDPQLPTTNFNRTSGTKEEDDGTAEARKNKNCTDLDKTAIAGKNLNKKRGRFDQNVQWNNFKKAKPLQLNSANEALQIVIVDEGHPKRKLNLEKWQQVEERIQDKLIERSIADSVEDITFHGTGWYHGYIVIACDNLLAKQFLEEFLPTLNDIWEGARIRAIPRSDIYDIFEKLKVWVWIPKPYVTAEKVVKLLIAQNNGLNAQNWKVLKELPRKEHGQYFLLQINGKSVPYIKANGGLINFSLSKIKLKLAGDQQTSGGEGNPDTIPPQ